MPKLKSVLAATAIALAPLGVVATVVATASPASAQLIYNAGGNKPIWVCIIAPARPTRCYWSS